MNDSIIYVSHFVQIISAVKTNELLQTGIEFKNFSFFFSIIVNHIITRLKAKEAIAKSDMRKFFVHFLSLPFSFEDYFLGGAVFVDLQIYY